MKVLKQSSSSASLFEGPTDIASPPALVKWLNRSPCIYSIVGEFGFKLKEMSNPLAPIHIAGLSRTYLDLYHKSGASHTLGVMAYSNKDDNTAIICSPAFTLISSEQYQKLANN
jgi:hypothetical protein